MKNKKVQRKSSSDQAGLIIQIMLVWEQQRAVILSFPYEGQQATELEMLIVNFLSLPNRQN